MHPSRYCPAMPAAPSYPTLSELECERADGFWTLLDEASSSARESRSTRCSPSVPSSRTCASSRPALSLDEGRADRALTALTGASGPRIRRSSFTSAVPPLRAGTAGRRACRRRARLAIQPDQAEKHAVDGPDRRVLGDAEAAELHARTAKARAGGFPPALAVGDEEFDRLVEESLRELPPEVRKHLDRLPVLVQPLPRVKRSPPNSRRSHDILGLFVVPPSDGATARRPPGPPGRLPLRRNLLRVCTDREELSREVRITVLHEVGHCSVSTKTISIAGACLDSVLSASARARTRCPSVASFHSCFPMPPARARNAQPRATRRSPQVVVLDRIHAQMPFPQRRHGTR